MDLLFTFISELFETFSQYVPTPRSASSGRNSVTGQNVTYYVPLIFRELFYLCYLQYWLRDHCNQYLPADKWFTHSEIRWNRSCTYIKFASCLVWCISRLSSSSIASLIWFCLLKICFSCKRYFVFLFFIILFFLLFVLTNLLSNFIYYETYTWLVVQDPDTKWCAAYLLLYVNLSNHKNVSEMLTLCICYRMLIFFSISTDRVNSSLSIHIPNIKSDISNLSFDELHDS